MIERIIENWLDNASEMSYQVPFCYMLANEGHTILHLTRHCGMEHGKDIITINPEGIVCAYQLKGAPKSKIKLKQWQSDLLGQCMQLLHTPVTHPSAPQNENHKSFLVTNGEIEEEVFNAINSINSKYKEKNLGQLNTIVRGQILQKAINLKDSFIPPELEDFKLLLEFYLLDGSGVIDKGKFSILVESIFFRKTNKSQFKTTINSAAILVSIAISNFSNKENHVAIIEAWTIYISYLFRFCEENKISENIWKNEYEITLQIIRNSLENLWVEVKGMQNLLVGSVLEDGFFLEVRTTWIIGFISYLGLIYKQEDNHHPEIQKINKFLEKYTMRIRLWGENQIPSILSLYWFNRITDATLKPTSILLKLINTILKSSDESDGLLDPYLSIEDSICYKLGLVETSDKNTRLKDSFYLEGIMHLFVRENFKQQMKYFWPKISRICFIEFQFENNIDFYLWKCSTGKELIKSPENIKVWQILKDEAEEDQGVNMPSLLKENFNLIPLFLMVFPHRGNAQILRYFDSKLKLKFTSL